MYEYCIEIATLCHIFLLNSKQEQEPVCLSRNNTLPLGSILSPPVPGRDFNRKVRSRYRCWLAAAFAWTEPRVEGLDRAEEPLQLNSVPLLMLSGSGGDWPISWQFRVRFSSEGGMSADYTPKCLFWPMYLFSHPFAMFKQMTSSKSQLFRMILDCSYNLYFIIIIIIIVSKIIIKCPRKSHCTDLLAYRPPLHWHTPLPILLRQLLLHFFHHHFASPAEQRVSERHNANSTRVAPPPHTLPASRCKCHQAQNVSSREIPPNPTAESSKKRTMCFTRSSERSRPS